MMTTNRIMGAYTLQFDEPCKLSVSNLLIGLQYLSAVPVTFVTSGRTH